MDNISVYALLDQYLIRDLIDVENILNGQNIFIMKSNGFTISIKKNKVFLNEINIHEIKEKYSDYAFRFYEYDDSFLQRINYEDFLNLDSDYNERIEGFLWKLESKIISSIQSTIEKHLEIGKNPQYFLKHTISKIEDNCEKLQSHFTNEGFKINLYNSFKTDLRITNTFKIVLNIYKSFIDILKSEFQNSISKLDSEVFYPNPFPRIFKDSKGYDFFLKLKDSICITKRTELADYSFVFRKMLEDHYIYEGFSESVFREFLNDNSEVALSKLKTFKTYNRKNLNLYNYLKSSIVPK